MRPKFGDEVYELNWNGVLGLSMALVVSLAIWTAVVGAVVRLVR
jgi:hypothetical protein